MDTQPPLTTGSAVRSMRRLGGLVGCALLGSLGFVASAGAAAVTDPPSTQPATPAAAAWYRPAPACALPIGCLPVSPPSTYPEGTLHVGVVAGQEDSRTYIALPLPSSGGVKGGSLQVPVAAAADGSFQPETAKIRACLVTGAVKDKVAGEMTKAPAADCSVSSPAVAKTSSTGTLLTIDLAPFVLDWSDGELGALALLPDATVAQTDVWHVAFSRHDRTGAGVMPISATLLVEDSGDVPPTTEDDVPSADPIAAPELPVATLNPPVSPGIVPEVVVDGTAPQAPSIAGSPNLVPAAAPQQDTSFAYPGVFLLPPLILLAAAWVARTFTRDLAVEQS